MTIEEKTIQDEKDRTIELKGTLRVEDYLTKLDIRLQKAVYIILVSTSVSILFYCIRSHLYTILLVYPLVIVLLAIITLLIIIWGICRYEKVLPRNTRKILKKSNMRNEQTYTINNKIITREIEGTMLHLNWSDIAESKEGKEIFLINIYNKPPNILYISKNKFSNSYGKLKLDRLEKEMTLRIPKRFFQSESDIIYFKELLEKNVPLNRKCYEASKR